MITVIIANDNSEIMNFPKICLKVRGIPMIVRNINNAILLKSKIIIVVLHPDIKDKTISIIKEYVKNTNIFYVIGKSKPLQSCVPILQMRNIDPFDKILILNSQQPLISFFTLNTFVKWNNKNESRILACKIDNPLGFCRLIRDNKYNFEMIKEEDECDDKELKNLYVFCDICMVSGYQLQSKYTNILDLLNTIKPSIYMLESKFQKELEHINDIKTLKKYN
jgi:bifunctional N-acetylglucosamine-1-phosphate-uridyltransferase/glucosamine-1-phosphate-acetyltransferase GlmU-like protein